MKPADSYLVLRVWWLREHDQVIGELVDLWLDRQAKQQPKPVSQRRRALRNTLIRIRSHVHAQ